MTDGTGWDPFVQQQRQRRPKKQGKEADDKDKADVY